MTSHPTDEQVLDAAAALMEEEGGRLSLTALARRVGVARGTLYRRFGDRKSLHAALVASGRLTRRLSSPRERILDATGRLISRQGLSATTLEAVASEAKVGVATVYRRFDDRRGLFTAFIEERTPRRLVTTLDLNCEPEEGLLAIARETLAFLRQYGGIFSAVHAPDPETAALFASVRSESTSARALTADFVDRHFPDPTGRTCLAFNGLLMSIGLAGKGSVDDDAHFLVSMFLRGVG